MQVFRAMRHWAAAAILLANFAATGAAFANEQASPAALLAFMAGEWVGTATISGRDGRTFQLTQTERVGPMLDGAIVVIEGRGYRPNGKLEFNAFGIVSRDDKSGAWQMRSYAGSSGGTFPFEPRDKGFVWSTPAGSGAVMRYTATFDGDVWKQVGEFVPKDGLPSKTFEMTLRRIRATTWPASGHVEPTG